MPRIRNLVGSILRDLVEARFEADLRVAELAETYRNHVILQELEVPTLNVRNVSLELRFAFDDSQDQAGGSSADGAGGGRFLGEAAERVAGEVAGLRSVSRRLGEAEERRRTMDQLRDAIRNVAAERSNTSPEALRNAVTEEVRTVLGERSIELPAADRRRLDTILDGFDEAVGAAARSADAGPGVLIGARQLAELSEDRISVMRVEVDLGGAQWVDVEENGERRSILTKRP